MPTDRQTIFVAGRGDQDEPVGGLYRYAGAGRNWSGGRLAAVADLAALAHHPKLPVIYGVSGGATGRLHAWRVDDTGADPIADLESGGSVPCHVMVHPAGGLLIVTHYTSGTLATWRLDPDGAPIGDAELIALDGAGSGIDPARQDLPHPHQAVLVGDELLVSDLGSDLVRRFSIESSGGSERVGSQTGEYRVPPGTGPRHLAVGSEGVLVVSGELAQTITVLFGRELLTIPSTGRTGQARSRPPRNYPGDVQTDPAGAVVYLANRGHDTITVIRLGDRAQLIAEVDSGVGWAQHLLLADGRLYVAGWDSSQVVSLPLDEQGIPGDPETCFSCPGAAWLLADPS